MIGLLLAVVFLPFFLLRVLIKTAVTLVMLPIALVMACIGVACAVFFVSLAIVIPLMPIVVLACGIWFIIRLASRPAAI